MTVGTIRSSRFSSEGILEIACSDFRSTKKKRKTGRQMGNSRRRAAPFSTRGSSRLDCLMAREA